MDQSADIRGLVTGYRRLPGVYDEMLDEAGQVRQQWLPLLEHFAALGPDQVRARFERADQYLKSSGVFHRLYDQDAGAERPWPLSHVPLVISAEDWQAISAGIVQRASLVEAILADSYGEAQLVRDGRLPAAVVAGSPEYLRPLHGVKPLGGRHLSLYSAHIGRDGQGRWWVIRDRTQAPSGAGYALENRIALSQALSDIYRQYGVTRHAPFFETFRSSLAAFRQPDDAGVCLLTPGPLNEAYFEHAYLARYLGFRLVEGQDLAVRDGRVYLRTITGPLPVSVLWRRIDADFADPLELNTNSRLGVAALIHAIRAGRVLCANTLGSGLAEAPALLGFMPALAQSVLGAPLLMPNVATWWCGQPAERQFVLNNLNKIALAPAFGAGSTAVIESGPVVGSSLDAGQREALVADLGRRGVDYIGQEIVRLSTTPVWENGRLEPRRFVLRVYAAATENGWTVMPGGLALVGSSIDAETVTMQQGARSADVWVMASAPVAPGSLLPPADSTPIRRATGALPSRAADNLFWLARYMERAEMTLRVVRALVSRLNERDTRNLPDTTALLDLLVKWGATPPMPGEEMIRAAARATFDSYQPGSVARLIGSARGAMSVVRDRFPPDAWRALDDLNGFIGPVAPEPASEGNILESAGQALRIMAAVTGLELENMNRLSGWRFLQLGARIERAIATCRIARQLAGHGAAHECLDVLLELTDSRITYRVRYLAPARLPVLDLVLLDDTNPRSLMFAAGQIAEHLRALPGLSPDGRASPALGMAEDLVRNMRVLRLDELDAATLMGFENSLMQLSNALGESYFSFRGPGF